MSWTTDLIDGTATVLAAAGLGTYGTLPADGTGIAVGVMPSAPDACLCLTPYVVEDTGGTDVVVGVQVRVRGGRDPREAEALADGVFDVLHNRRSWWAGPVPVAVSYRQSQAPLGQDDQGRCEIAANYYMQTTRPYPGADE